MIEPNAFINGDCMDFLHEYPNNYFDLAVVDPPYGDAGWYTTQSSALADGGNGTSCRPPQAPPR